MSPLVIGIIAAVILIIIVIVIIVMSSGSSTPSQSPTPTPSVPTPSPISGQVAPSPLVKVDCKVTDWNIPSDTTCTVKSDGKWYKTKTRTVLVQPSNGGAICPPLSEDMLCQSVNCQVGSWNNSQVCDPSGNRTRTRTILVQPKFGGNECPPLTESFKDDKCFSDEICGTVVENMNLTDNATLQNKIYNLESNKLFWEGYNCSLENKKSSGISKDNLCAFAVNNLNNSDYRIREASSRARFLLQCPGTMINVTNFVGAGTTTNNYFTITVKSVPSSGGGINSSSHQNVIPSNNANLVPPLPSSVIQDVMNGNILMLGKNIGKQIRIWYKDDGTPTGWALNNNWVYPPAFQGLTVNDFGIFEIPSSAIEIYDKPVGTGKRNKILLWISNYNNPVAGIKDIVANKPRETTFSFGADKDTFLGSKNFTGYITYGDEPIPSEIINLGKISELSEKVCVGLIGKYPMTPRVSWSKDGKETYPQALRASTYTPLTCDQYYEGTTGNPINGTVSIDQMCDAIKQAFTKQSEMPSSILAAYNDSCSSSSTYQLPQYVRHNNLYRIMTSRLNLQP